MLITFFISCQNSLLFYSLRTDRNICLVHSVKNVFLKISQNTQENTFPRVDFNFIKKRDPGTGVFLQILQNFEEHFFL